MLRVKIQKILPYFSKHVFLKEKNSDECDDLELPVVRVKPEGLDVLCRKTKFSRKELQIMYRGFKQECPSGSVDEETFKSIYAQFFPQGDASVYAHYVFNAFDADRKGSLSFEDFVICLSVLVRGSVTDKLRWVFSLYDINGDGFISRDEMLSIIGSIYGMLGTAAAAAAAGDGGGIGVAYGMEAPGRGHLQSAAAPGNFEGGSCASMHVERVFQKMDVNSDGVISIDEFMNTCQQDDSISKSFAMFDTIL